MEKISTCKIEKYFKDIRKERSCAILKNPFIKYNYFRKKKDLMDFIPKNTKSLLDIGCNTGEVEHLLVNIRPDIKKITGFDISKELIKEARETVTSVKFCVDDSTNMSFKSSSFDCIIMCGVIEHISDKDAALKEIYRVLKPNGRAIITSVNQHNIILKLHQILENFGSKLYGRKVIDKDEYISLSKLKHKIQENKVKIRYCDYKYFIPLVVTIIKNTTVGLLPPLNPGALVRFTELLSFADKINIPNIIKKQLFWSYFIVYEKSKIGTIAQTTHSSISREK